MTVTQNLATDFLNIARKAKGLDSAANSMLSTVKAAGIKNLDQLNEAVRLAYAENRWSQSAGRPAAGSKLKPAPEAVKQILTHFRNALRLGMHFNDFETVYQMREAIKERQASAHAEGPEPRAELKGVQIKSPHSLIGALWHDAITLAEEMPDDRAEEFEREVRMVMQRFLRFAPPELVQVDAAA